MLHGAMDESGRVDHRGLHYIVAAVVVLEDPAAASERVGKVVSGRTSPFHWHKEGPVARGYMLDALAEIGAQAHVFVHHPTDLRKQETARTLGLQVVVPKLLADEIDHLTIESRGPVEDARDRATILSCFREAGKPGAFGYEWHGKEDCLLWTADAVCGAVGDGLVGASGAYIGRLTADNVIVHIDYRP